MEADGESQKEAPDKVSDKTDKVPQKETSEMVSEEADAEKEKKETPEISKSDIEDLNQEIQQQTMPELEHPDSSTKLISHSTCIILLLLSQGIHKSKTESSSVHARVRASSV